MMKSVVTFLTGVLFAMGLGVSGMKNPNKVLGFLDLFGAWDPSLALVMLGAVGVNLVLFPLILRRNRPMLGETWHLPSTQEIDLRLVLGSVIFGVGWGIAGFCPGPAIATLGFGKVKIFVFGLSMVLGAALYSSQRKISGH